MKYNIPRHLTVLALLLWGLFPATAQSTAPIPVIDSGTDSLTVREIRARMDSIRQYRPTVGLVLSGGGAKGAAHVGAYRYLREQGIPIDIVVGTSIGGLVGGLISLGYECDQLDSLVTGIDWDVNLSDKVPRKYVSYNEKKYNEKYLFSLPFYYRKNDYLEKLATDMKYDTSDQDLYEEFHFGAEGGESSREMLRKNVLGSLPAGIAHGQNVNNLISSLTVGYQDSIRFSKLPIPFVCVATELVTGRAKIWYGGKINVAMRSTMSVPGLFAPMRDQGMVLVDGGMRNNYPTDIARRLGADIVIGIDLAKGFNSYSEINNILDVISVGIDMLGRSSYEENFKDTEVSLIPDVTGYTMMSFDPVAMRTLLKRGYDTARKNEGNLAAAKELIGPDTLRMQSRPAIDLAQRKVLVSSIEIDGVADKDAKYLMSKLSLRVPSVMGIKEIDNAVATLYGTKSFDYVTFELLGEEEPFLLKLHCKPGPINHIGIGARIDTEEIVSMLFNLGVNSRSVSGLALDLEGKISVNPLIKGTVTIKNAYSQALNFSTMYHYVDRDEFSVGKSNFKAAYHNVRNELYFSNVRWHNYNFKVGVRDDYFKIKSMMTDDIIGDYDLERKKNNYLSTFIFARRESFDDGYFPTKGFSLGIDWQWVFASLENKLDPFNVIQANLEAVAFNTDYVAFIPFARGRALLGHEFPLPFVNTFGGIIPGRYLDQQMPFVGLNNSSTADDVLLIGGAHLRFHFARNNYLTATVNVGDSWPGLEDVFSKDDSEFLFGAGVQYAYNSIVGPLRAQIHYSNITKGVGAYLSLGLNF